MHTTRTTKGFCTLTVAAALCGCPGVAAVKRPVPILDAAALDARAARLADSPDSLGYAILFWQRAAAAYSARGDAAGAAVALENIADTYAGAGREAVAGEYYHLASAYYRSALASGRPAVTEAQVRLQSYSSARAQISAEMPTVAATSLYIGQFYVSQGETDSALAYFGDEAALKRPVTTQAAIALLELNPLLDTVAVSHSGSQEFIDRVNHLVRIVASDTTSRFDVKSLTQAVERLEAIVAHQKVTATVTSLPPGASVRYWPLLDDSTVAVELTTDAAQLLRPAAYVFAARDGRGRPQRQLKNCATNCTVSFLFRDK